MPGMSRFAAVSLGLTLASCQAIGSEDYLGEPLLQFHGQAIVNEPTGGVALRPALCFDGTEHTTGELDTDFIPKEALKGFEGLTLSEYDRPYTTIVEVESDGEFPSDFSVSAYLPPPQSSIESAFNGEPRSALGSICAVREDHPEVAYMPFGAANTTCKPDETGPCNVSFLYLRPGTERYYVESYDCASRETKLEDCELQTWGDDVLKRERFEGVVGFSEVNVEYLVDEAPAESFFAYKYGATKTLKPGFYLFQPVDGPEFDGLTCTVEAALRAEDDIRDAFPDPLDPAVREAADELFARKQAHYMRESSCRTANYRELSSDQALSIEIRNEAFPTFDPREINP